MRREGEEMVGRREEGGRERMISERGEMAKKTFFNV